MPLGKEVGHGPGHIVSDKDPVGTQPPHLVINVIKDQTFYQWSILHDSARITVMPLMALAFLLPQNDFKAYLCIFKFCVADDDWRGAYRKNVTFLDKELRVFCCRVI